MNIHLKNTRLSGKFRFFAAAIVFILTLGAPVGISALGSSPHIERTKHGLCLSGDRQLALSEGQSANQKIHVIYCMPYDWAKGTRQVDVLTEGSTYTSMYWMWPQRPNLYSYTEKTLKAGRAVLAYDRLGSGKSARPASTDITMDVDAHILHQLVRSVRSLGFKQVNSIGHSYGSGIALHEAATYQDVNRLVLTGYLHIPSNPTVVAGSYPANQDPKFSGQGLDDGYLTTRPGNPPARQTSFYSAAADPDVIAYDEAHKDLVSRTGLLDFLAERSTPTGTNISQQVTVPTLAISGKLDAIFCYDPATLDCANTEEVRTHEGAYYTNAPNFTFVGVADTGHNLPLHPSAKESFQTINKWLKAH